MAVAIWVPGAAAGDAGAYATAAAGLACAAAGAAASEAAEGGAEEASAGSVAPAWSSLWGVGRVAAEGAAACCVAPLVAGPDSFAIARRLAWPAAIPAVMAAS